MRRAELDDCFHRRAGQDEKRNVARVFVAWNDALQVIGFYSLNSYALVPSNLPDDVARKLPRYDLIPAALIGRLARDNRVRGEGVGGLLLADAMRRILGAGRSMAVFAIVVEAKNERAASFYREFGFRAFPSRPDKLFMPASLAIAALERL